jgi:hypothetical protein
MSGPWPTSTRLTHATDDPGPDFRQTLGVEVRGVEPRSSDVSPPLLRAQPAVWFRTGRTLPASFLTAYPEFIFPVRSRNPAGAAYFTTPAPARQAPTGGTGCWLVTQPVPGCRRHLFVVPGSLTRTPGTSARFRRVDLRVETTSPPYQYCTTVGGDRTFPLPNPPPKGEGIGCYNGSGAQRLPRSLRARSISRSISRALIFSLLSYLRFPRPRPSSSLALPSLK